MSISDLRQQGILWGAREVVITWPNVAAGLRLKSADKHADDPRITITYHLPANRSPVSYSVTLAPTDCYFGGQRWWFLCPLSIGGRACNRRVGKLYFGYGYFGCRHCLRLAYGKRNENRRYKYYGLLRFIELEELAKQAYSQITRFTYAGKPTKKLMRYYKLSANGNMAYNND